MTIMVIINQPLSPVFQEFIRYSVCPRCLSVFEFSYTLFLYFITGEPSLQLVGAIILPL